MQEFAGNATGLYYTTDEAHEGSRAFLEKHGFTLLNTTPFFDTNVLLYLLTDDDAKASRAEELLDIVWGRDGFVEPRTVDVHVARLRGKFTAAKAEEPGIETVRGVGYRFRDAKP